ncbi:MAG: hypothetical protein H7061_11560 [Bdellovibrionaceae bacterium]|nr:hypothetical protein [Bdellovibrio sp.]
MSKKLDKEIKKFIKSYETKGGLKWKVCLPDGSGGQLRFQGLLSEEIAASFAQEKYRKMHLSKDSLFSQIQTK